MTRPRWWLEGTAREKGGEKKINGKSWKSEAEKRCGSCSGVGGDSGIRFGARCGAVATPARLGIQLTATRDRSLRRFLLGLTGITRGGCSRRIRSDCHGNLPRRFSAPGAVRDPTISRGINDKKRCWRRAASFYAASVPVNSADRWNSALIVI